MEELCHSNVFNGMVALNATRGQAGSEGARQPVLGTQALFCVRAGTGEVAEL